MKKILSVTAAFAAILWLNGAAVAEEPILNPDAAPVLSESVNVDATAEPVAGATTETATTETTATETEGSKFASRERLMQTLLGQLAAPAEGPVEEPAATGEGETNTTDVTENTASGEGQASQSDMTTEATPSETLAVADATSGDAGTDNLSGSGETPPAAEQTADSSPDASSGTPPSSEARVAAFVDSLSDEQVFALNRSLNNVAEKGLIAEFDMDMLERIVDEDFGKQGINALTKAMEEEAKFMGLYEQTGNEKFLERAEAQKEKFLGKVERVQVRDMAKEQVRDESRLTLRGAAKSEAKAAAAETAKMLAREAAKAVAKDEARQAAKHAAREAAKEAAKQVAKEVTKENQRGGRGRNNRS